jgi:hypothetical protein
VAIAACDRHTLPPLIEHMQEIIWEELHNDSRLVGSATVTL